MNYRSREWVCPHCYVPNLQLLPDSPGVPSPVHALSSPIPSAHDTIPSPNDCLPGSSVPQSQLSGPESADTTNVNSAPASEPATSDSSQVINSDYPAPSTRRSASSTQRAPLLLDTAICVLLVLVCALICRRLV
jgi:ubiquitin-conjugating enzyme E2 J1